MNAHRLRRPLGLALAALGLTVQAQVPSAPQAPGKAMATAVLPALAAAGRSPRPDPTDAQAPVPPTTHASVFSRYRRWTDEPARPWRAANDTAGGVGGWRAYAREAQQGGPSVPTVPTVPTAPVGAASAAAGPGAVPAAASAPPAARPPAAGHSHHGQHQP